MRTAGFARLFGLRGIVESPGKQVETRSPSHSCESAKIKAPRQHSVAASRIVYKYPPQGAELASRRPALPFLKRWRAHGHGRALSPGAVRVHSLGLYRQPCEPREFAKGRRPMQETSTISTPSRADGLSPADAQTIASEAYLYAYPMLYNYKTLFQQVMDPSFPGYIGGFNRFRHYSRGFTPADTDIVTPNNDTPYSWAWLDLRAEPMVVSVPATSDRYYVLQWFDLYTHNFAYIGSRATGTEAGD